MADEEHIEPQLPEPTDLAELAGRPVCASELIGAALSADPTYRRLVVLRLRREFIESGTKRPKVLVLETLQQLGGPLPERARKLQSLFADAPLLLSLLPGAARPPLFANAAGWRRGEKRVRVNWQMVCVFSDERTVPCRVLDVSEKGCFLSLDKPALQGLAIGHELSVRMPDELAQLVAPLVLHGLVRWTGYSVHHQARGAGLLFPAKIAGLEAWLRSEV